VDCDQKLLYSFDPFRNVVTTTTLPHNPGSYAFRQQGGLIMAYRNGLSLLDVRGEVERYVAVEQLDFSTERFNDGACDRRGRFWVGTMDRKLKSPVGSLYRVDPDSTIKRIESGLICSNGIAFSPDDRVMYHTDTGAARIYASDFDLESGEVANRRVFCDFSDQPGRPDGCTIDAEGFLWVAEIGGAEVVRLSPEGEPVGAVSLPVGRPTSVAFGGADLCTLFVTTMRFGMSSAETTTQPEAGCVFSFEVDVPGLVEPRFAG
jgi:sugar lactone lactonase YvrE